jgi:hypothetical protein
MQPPGTGVASRFAPWSIEPRHGGQKISESVPGLLLGDTYDPSELGRIFYEHCRAGSH